MQHYKTTTTNSVVKWTFLNQQIFFEKFVETFAHQYGINPSNSYSTPGYTWQAGLKLTEIKLDFIKYINLLQFTIVGKHCSWQNFLCYG